MGFLADDDFLSMLSVEEEDEGVVPAFRFCLGGATGSEDSEGGGLDLVLIGIIYRKKAEDDVNEY